VNRRRFLAAAFAGALAGLPGPRLWAWRSRREHPVPRPGITAANVLTKEQLGDNERVLAVFDAVREIPQIVDGIRCKCGCADLEGFYSLLSCFEGDGMARACPICQGEGRLAARLHKEGKTLDQIREAIDARWP
jgi:hypothetical protein